MTRLLLLFLLSSVTLFAQRTPMKINGVVVNNPNFTNTASLTWSVVGSNVSGTAAGGGDNIWTNDNGTVSATSTVADSPGSAFRMNSSNLLVTSGSILAEIQNAGTNVIYFPVNALGGAAIYQGQGALNWFGAPNGEALITYYDAGIGEPHYVEIDGIADDTVTGGRGFYKLDVESTGQSRFQIGKTDGTNEYRMEILAANNGFDPGRVMIQARVNGTGATNLMKLEPTTADNNTPYILNSEVTHSAGNLVEVGNNDTNKFWITFDGKAHASDFVVDGSSISALYQPIDSDLTALAVNSSNGLWNRTGAGSGAAVSTSAGLFGAISDETGSSSGTPLAVFNQNPTLQRLTVTGSADVPTVTMNGGSITGSGVGPIMDLSGTINSSGNADFITINPTNTAIGSLGNVINVKSGGTSVAQLRPRGALIFPFSSVTSVNAPGVGSWAASLGLFGAGGALVATVDSARINMSAGFSYAWAADTFLNRESAAVVQLGDDAATATAQKLKAHDGLGTDKVGADLTASPGNGTGTGKSGAFIVTTTPFSTTGSSQNSPVGRFIVPPEINLTDAATSAFEIALPTLRTAGGLIQWTVEAGDGTDVQSYSGETRYAVANKGGVYTKQIVADPDDEAKGVTGGSTLTGAWSILDGTNKVTLQFTPTGSLTETTYRLFFTIQNNSRQAITLLYL